MTQEQQAHVPFALMPADTYNAVIASQAHEILMMRQHLSDSALTIVQQKGVMDHLRAEVEKQREQAQDKQSALDQALTDLRVSRRLANQLAAAMRETDAMTPKVYALVTEAEREAGALE